MLLPLTEKQTQVLNQLVDFFRTFEYPPTITELQKGLDVHNPGSIHKSLQALERKGYISRHKGLHRSTMLTDEVQRKYLQ